jgi:ABC-type transporter Mla maintaining outer membrane lipid asymmetry ATPase subunit MlaF
MLTVEQHDALNAAKSGHNLLICGQAGTGKTFVIKSIINDLKQNANVVLLCTTGIGCMQYSDLGARTVHRYVMALLYGFGNQYECKQCILCNNHCTWFLQRIIAYQQKQH